MPVVSHGIDAAAQHVLDAAGSGLFGQAHVPRQHPHPHAAANRQALVAHPQAAARKIHPRQMPAVVHLAHRAIEHGASVVPQRDGQIDAGQRLRQGPAGHHPAVVHHHQGIGQPRHFIGRVADIQHRNVQLAAQALQVGQDFLFALQVERGQRLVHQQQARVHGQCPRNADPLALATRQGARFAVQQMANSQQRDRLIKARLLCTRGALQAVAQVAHHRKMRKQAGLLEHIANGALVRWHPAAGVLPHFITHHQAPLRCALQPGDAAQQRCLARAGMPKQRGHATHGQAQIHIEGKVGPVEPKACFDAAHVSRLSGAAGARHTGPTAPQKRNPASPPKAGVPANIRAPPHGRKFAPRPRG